MPGHYGGGKKRKKKKRTKKKMSINGGYKTAKNGGRTAKQKKLPMALQKAILRKKLRKK